jgi:hypothetical protein
MGPGVCVNAIPDPKHCQGVERPPSSLTIQGIVSGALLVQGLLSGKLTQHFGMRQTLNCHSDTSFSCRPIPNCVPIP